MMRAMGECKWSRKNSYEATAVAEERGNEDLNSDSELQWTVEFGRKLNYRCWIDSIYNISLRQKVKFKMTWRFPGYEVEIKVTN